MSRGTEFEQKVWNALKQIPFGETRSYKQIAEFIGQPSAARAVANACGKNPYPVKVPCHRAIRSDGTIGGYSGVGGVKTKIGLLESEKSKLQKQKRGWDRCYPIKIQSYFISYYFALF